MGIIHRSACIGYADRRQGSHCMYLTGPVPAKTWSTRARRHPLIFSPGVLTGVLTRNGDEQRPG